MARDSPPAEVGLIGGRYRIDTELGRGGMARVYRVTDERTGDQLALKRLVVDGSRSATLQAMFEHEYHTLAQLAHPRIVRAFEYGVDGGTPYYTMELLDGADLREAFRNQPPGVELSCALLRDIASALALIHSRRMVHRDVGPRNVWCTPERRAKLIDFGTLVAMGPQTRAAGTPPFMPPEAVHMQPLDARCDIYALGALAYFMLTGRHAYPAREIAELRQVWQRGPKRPDAIADVPRALADLVMAMLSLDARGRPASAAEVFERLSMAAGLPAEDERQNAEAFLSSPKLVGRENESGALRKRLLRATRGRGSAVAVVAPAGLGRSRMLASLVIEAKLLGAAAINVDASAVGSGPFAVAGALAERLLSLMPLAAAAAIDVANVLGHVSPAVHRALGEPALAELGPLDRTLKITSALVTLVEVATRTQRVLIAVDDIHRADAASLGVLGKISLLAADHRLLLVTSCDAAVLAQPPPAIEELCQPRHRIELPPLAPADTRELLESLFGAVPGLDGAASWLHELSQGSPQTCMQYAQYLVDEGIARYQRGQWKLPTRLREQALPPSLGAMLEKRLAALSDDARALALGLALARDETRAVWQPETHVRIEDFPKLIGGDGARAFHALDELLHAGLIQQRDAFYVLGQRAIMDALLRVTDEETRTRAHGRLAEVLLQDGYRMVGLLGIQHLQRAGEHRRARDLLVRASDGYRSNDGNQSHTFDAMRLSVSTECGLEALAQYREHGGTPREGILLRRILMLACSVYDWSNARVGADQVAQLRSDCGLVYWEQTDPSLAPVLRTLECLKRAQEEHGRKAEADRGFDPLEAVTELAGVSVGLSGAFLHMHDVAGTDSVPSVVAPLRALAPASELLGQVCDQSAAALRGREIGDSVLATAQAIGQDAMLPAVIRAGLSLVHLHVQVVEDARRGRKRAVEMMDLLASVVSGDMFYAFHGRWLGYAFGGQAKLATQFRKQVEMITEDDVWRRNAFLFAEAHLHALTGDLPSLQRTSEAIAVLAAEFPGWQPWLAFCRGEMHRLRGELDGAIDELAAGLAAALPGEHRAWVLLAPAHAELLLLRGDAHGASREASEIVERVQALGLDRTAAIAGERVRALAASRLGEHIAARISLDRAFAAARELDYGGLPLARLYDAQARVTTAAADAGGCTAALEHMWQLLQHADAPALFQAYEGLREGSGRPVSVFDLPVTMPFSRDSVSSGEAFTQLRTRFNELDDRRERAQHALQLLLEDSGAHAGHLFLFDAGGAFAAASLGPRAAGESLTAAVRAYLEAELQETRTAIVTAADIDAGDTRATGVLVDGDIRLTPSLLCDAGDGPSKVVGLALLAAGDAVLRAPRADLVRAIARCLVVAGDSDPMTGAED